MITRIHGASSTLAANPRKKHRRVKRRNPAGAARVKKTPEERKAAALARLRKAQQALSRLVSPAKKKPKKRKGLSETQIAARREKAAARATKRAGSAAKRAFRQEYGYSMKALPAGANALAYVYRGAKGGLISSPNLMRGKKRKPRFTIYKSASGSFGLHKNPAIGKLVIAGVPVVNMAIGSAATIFIGGVSKKLIAKFAPAVASSPIGDIAGELATAGIAAYLHGSKFLKNPMHKSIAQFAFIGAVFQILSKKATPFIEKGVDMIPGLSGYEGYTGGVYFDPYTESPAVGGAYLSADSGDMAGIYTSVDSGSAVGGLGLFNAPSIYG